MELADVGRPEEVRVDGGQHDEDDDHQRRRATPPTDGVRVQRPTDGHVALERDGDDQPHRVVADRVADGVEQLARPGGVLGRLDARHLADPEAQQAGVQHERVGDGEDGEVEVGGEAAHRAQHQDGERQHVAGGADRQQDRRHVQQQHLVAAVRRVLHQPLLVASHVHLVVRGRQHRAQTRQVADTAGQNEMS